MGIYVKGCDICLGSKAVITGINSMLEELINQYHDNFLAGHFGINKTKVLIGQKYNWPDLQKNIKMYVKGCDIWLGLKAVKHKPYSNLQSFPVLTHCWINLFMDFVTGLPISTD